MLSGGAIGACLAGCSGGGGSSVPAATQIKPTVSQLTSAPSTGASASIAIMRSQKSGMIPSMLGGLSYEKSKIWANFFNTANVGLIGCFQRLGPSVLRIGGNSVDQLVWNPSGPGETSGEVAPTDIKNLAQFVQNAGWRVIYGINFATNTPASAAAEAAYAANVFGSSLAAFEIGNECDLYANNGLRASTYDLADFVIEWLSYVTAIRLLVPNAPISGPASAAMSDVASWTVPFATGEASQINLLTQHYYRGNGDSSTSTMSELLTPDQALPTSLQLLHRTANSLGISGGYRLAEANSFYNGGAVGVSNAYGSALWAADFLLLNALNGSAGVNFHGGWDDNGYTPIADSHGVPVEIRPVYYGMLFVAQIPQGPMYVLNLSSDVSMTAYAVAGNDGATYLAIINKDASNAVSATIDLGATATSASALVLAGAGLSATNGTTLGGSQITTSGAWSPNAEPSISADGSALSATVAAASAVLLKIL